MFPFTQMASHGPPPSTTATCHDPNHQFCLTLVLCALYLLSGKQTQLNPKPPFCRCSPGRGSQPLKLRVTQVLEQCACHSVHTVPATLCTLCTISLKEVHSLTQWGKWLFGQGQITLWFCYSKHALNNYEQNKHQCPSFYIPQLDSFGGFIWCKAWSMHLLNINLQGLYHHRHSGGEGQKENEVFRLNKSQRKYSTRTAEDISVKSFGQK